MSDSGVSKRVAARFKKAMPTVFRNLGDNTNWGFGTGRQEPRMHLQTLDPNHLGDDEFKVWLENRGQRVFEIAKIPRGKSRAMKAFKSLEEELRANRVTVEHKWVQITIANGWIKPILKDEIVELVVYPSYPTKFTVELDLRKELPGLFSSNTIGKPQISQETIGFYAEHAMLVLNVRDPPTNHIDFYLPKLICRD